MFGVLTVFLFGLSHAANGPSLTQMVATGTATPEMIAAAVQSGALTPQQGAAMNNQLTQCPHGVYAHTIPRATTPMEPGENIGYAGKLHGVDEFEAPYLGCCSSQPIDSGIPDLTGMYEVQMEMGTLFTRIEQCGNRLLIAGNGVVHDWPAINDDATTLQDVSSMCVGMPSAFVDNPVASLQALGLPAPSCEMLVMAGTDGCTCHLHEALARSNGNCIELYVAENPDEVAVTWCKQDNGDVVRNMQTWIGGNAITTSTMTFVPYTPPSEEQSTSTTPCPATIQAMLDSGAMTLAQAQQMIQANGGSLDVIAACAQGGRRKL